MFAVRNRLHSVFQSLVDDAVHLHNLPVTSDRLFFPTVGEVKDCADLYGKLISAWIADDLSSEGEFWEKIKFSDCDPGWVEILEQFLIAARLKQSSIPYRTGGDYVFEGVLTANSTVAFVGDWGTGSDVARQVMGLIAQHKPNILIHLGDIYYSGTPAECQNRFLGPARAILPVTTLMFSLCGNHDVYSGGQGYYWLVDALGQRSSYFCLRNQYWQFHAMDTGYNDFDPLDADSHQTYLRQDEWKWHCDRANETGQRKVVLLSHHQPFSAFEAIGGKSHNYHLLSQVASFNVEASLWLWGHEHRMAIYDPTVYQQRIVRGRCVGNGAIPVSISEGQYIPGYDVPYFELHVGDDGQTYNHGYAIMQLAGKDATMKYYEMAAGKENLLFEEAI